MLRVVVLLAWFAALAPAQEFRSLYRRGFIHPDLELPKTDGTRGRLSDCEGKTTLIFHFASW